jgi:hypothetical protein
LQLLFQYLSKLQLLMHIFSFGEFKLVYIIIYPDKFNIFEEIILI